MSDKNGDNYDKVFEAAGKRAAAGFEEGRQQQQDHQQQQADLLLDNGCRPATAENDGVGGSDIVGNCWMGSSWMGTSINNLAENTDELKTENMELRMRCMELENKSLKQELGEVKKAMRKLESDTCSMEMVLKCLRDQAHTDEHSAVLIKKLEPKLTHLMAHHLNWNGACLVKMSDNCWDGKQGSVGMVVAIPHFLLATCQSDNPKEFTNLRSKLAFSDKFYSTSETGHFCRHLFYAEFSIKKQFGKIFVGLSDPDFAIANNNIWVGKSAGSVGICSDGTFWNAGEKHDEFARVPFAEDDIVGIGLLLLSSEKKSQLFFTKNGKPFGIPIPFPWDWECGSNKLFPTITLQGIGTTVEANFGADLVRKPFRCQWTTIPSIERFFNNNNNDNNDNGLLAHSPNCLPYVAYSVEIKGCVITKINGKTNCKWATVMANFAYFSFYFEVNVLRKDGKICIGMSGSALNGNINYVGEVPDSFGIFSDGSYCYSGDYTSGYFPGGFDANDTVGCGICSSKGMGKRLFFATKNGAIHGTPIPLPSNASAKMFPAISVNGQGTSVEANFGNDPNKPLLHSQLMQQMNG